MPVGDCGGWVFGSERLRLGQGETRVGLPIVPQVILHEADLAALDPARARGERPGADVRADAGGSVDYRAHRVYDLHVVRVRVRRGDYDRAAHARPAVGAERAERVERRRVRHEGREHRTKFKEHHSIMRRA